MNNEWETQRLRHLLPNLSDADLKPLLRNRWYGHIMPSYKQAKLMAWDMLKFHARDVEGAKPNESELLIKFANGSRVQLFGADKPDRLRGSGFSGLSLDEFSQQPRNIFSEVLSKSLADHVGYAIFSGTIKGKDHLYATFQAAKNDPEWFTLWQDIDRSLVTENELTVTVLTKAMADDRALIANGLMTQAEFDQEWYLSPEAAIKGSYYGQEMAAARKEGRITSVPYDPALPVDTDWDLGMADNTSIWFSQSLRSGEVRLIDFLEASGEGFPFYARKLQEKGYVYGKHWGPHDIVVRELGSGRSRQESAAALGIKFEITPRLHQGSAEEISEGIHAVRLLLPRCWFDEKKTEEGRTALLNYRRSFNASLNEFQATPVHNFASHASDAFRGLAVRQKPPKEKRPDEGYGGRSSDTSTALSWMGG